jgi:hypothetical protein
MRSIKIFGAWRELHGRLPPAELNRIIGERAQPVNGCSDWHRAST